MLQGVVGTGKTALLEEFGGRAREAGARLLRASGAPTESSLSLGIVRQLLAGEVFDREEAATVRGLLDHQLLADAACDGVSRSRVLDGLASVVLGLAGRGTVVIVVDDAQYLDAFSQDWLIYLLRRAGHARLLIVFGWRDDDVEMCEGNGRLLCAELYQQAYLRRLLLGPLSSGGVARLVAGRLLESGSAELAVQAHRLTGGNLLLLHGLLEDSRAAAGGSLPAELSTGPEFERAVQLVLARCDPLTLRVAGAISVIGEPSGFAYLDRLVGVPSDRVAVALQVLTRTGLVEAGRMRHPVMAQILALLLRAGWREDLRASVGHLPELTEAMLGGRLRGRDTTLPVIMLLLQGRVEDACSVLSRLAADVPPGSGPSWELEMVRMWLADVYPGIFRRVACESRTNGTPVTPPGAIGYRLLEHFQSSHHQGATAERLGQADEALWQQPLTEINLLPLILALRTMVYAERLEEAGRPRRFPGRRGPAGPVGDGSERDTVVAHGDGGGSPAAREPRDGRALRPRAAAPDRDGRSPAGARAHHAAAGGDP
nr:ATP-binding protein [Streptomyces olivaceus]